MAEEGVVERLLPQTDPEEEEKKLDRGLFREAALKERAAEVDSRNNKNLSLLTNPHQQTEADPTEVPGVPQELVDRARNISENYDALAASRFDRAEFLPPVQEEETSKVTDFANFLFGDDLAAVGVSVDGEGMSWDLDTMFNQWTEHPIQSSFALAAYALPVLAGATKGARATKYASVVNDNMMKSLNRIDSNVSLEQVPQKYQDILRKQVYNADKYRELKERIEGGNASRIDNVRYYLHKQFANAWSLALDPQAPISMKTKYIDQMVNAGKDTMITKHLADMPTDPRVGVAVSKFFLDPSELKNVPEKYQAWAVNLANDLRATQRKGWEEGFIDDDTYSSVGDIWFSTMRQGTKLAEQGPTMGVLFKAGDKVMQANIPRTTSPHLLKRGSSKGEITSLLQKQEAVDLLETKNPNKALKLLKGDEHEEVRGLIAAGDTETAIARLSDEPFLNVTPENLTVGGLLQQKMLFENFRYLRDLVMDPNYVKKGAEIAGMPPRLRKQWVNLDKDLPNSHIVRRMIDKAGGNSSELGFMNVDMFKELIDINNGQRGVMGMVNGGMLELLTTIHKTSRTSLNLPTHGQNVLGNLVFLHMAGMNPMTPSNFKLLTQSIDAVEGIYAARRGGKAIAEVKGLGTVDSIVNPGQKINIADELQLQNVRDMIELSSIESAEGLKNLARFAQESPDGATFTNKLAQYMQKGAQKAVPGTTLSVERLSDIYMAEDAVPKLAYYMNLRRNGMSPDSAAMEVARRLPMYHTTGRFVAGSRKVLLPWISFPAEAFRIMKNNVEDYPLRTAMWLHAPNMVQAAMGLASGQSYEEVKDVKTNLPVWAQRSSTVVTPHRDSNDNIRAAVLDWLPHTAILPPSTAKEVSPLKKLPMGLDNPMPIFGGIVSAMTGKDAWGRDVPNNPDTIGDDIWRSSLNLMGFVAPPFVQKYLLNTSGPSPTYRWNQDMGNAVNPYTEEPGDFWLDFVHNNSPSLGKMYASSAEQGLANLDQAQKNITAYRGKLTRNFNAYTKSGYIEDASKTLKDVMRTFTAEWKDPAIANRKFGEWLTKHQEAIGRHPQLRGFSKEELQLLISRSVDNAGKTRTAAQAERVAAMRQEMTKRGQQGGGLSLIDLPDFSKQLDVKLPETKVGF